jgi:hypothetical protein
MLACLAPEIFQNLPWFARKLVGPAAAFLIVLSFVLGESAGFPFPLAVLPVMATIGIIYSILDHPEGLVARALGLKPAVVCGRCSYSLYLWHWPIMVLLRWTVGLDGVGAQVAALILTFVAAVASYNLVEQPFRHNLKTGPRSRVVVLVCALTIVAAAAAWVESRVGRHLTLSVTGRHSDWYAEAKPIPTSSASGCAVDMDRSQFLGAIVTHWKPKGCAAKDPGRLIVLGDSHALAIAPTLARLASELGVEVIDYSKTYCGFLTLQRALSATSECAAYGAGVEQKLSAFLRPGDVVILESLRMPRFMDQDGTMSANSVSTLAQKSAATNEAVAILKRMTAHGAKVIFPLPLPVLPSPPFRCSDWFNRNNPVCQGGLSIEKVAVDALRSPVKEQIKAIAAAVPGVTVWDPLPIVCPGAACAASLNGRPVFFDGDHLSGYGNQVIYPAVRRIVQRQSKQ